MEWACYDTDHVSECIVVSLLRNKSSKTHKVNKEHSNQCLVISFLFICIFFFFNSQAKRCMYYSVGLLSTNDLYKERQRRSHDGEKKREEGTSGKSKTESGSSSSKKHRKSNKQVSVVFFPLMNWHKFWQHWLTLHWNGGLFWQNSWVRSAVCRTIAPHFCCSFTLLLQKLLLWSSSDVKLETNFVWLNLHSWTWISIWSVQRAHWVHFGVWRAFKSPLKQVFFFLIRSE